MELVVLAIDAESTVQLQSLCGIDNRTLYHCITRSSLKLQFDFSAQFTVTQSALQSFGTVWQGHPVYKIFHSSNPERFSWGQETYGEPSLIHDNQGGNK